MLFVDADHAEQNTNATNPTYNIQNVIIFENVGGSIADVQLNQDASGHKISILEGVVLFFPRYHVKKKKRSVCTKLSCPNMHRKLCSYKIVVWYAWCRFHLKCFSFIIKIYFTCSTVFTCYDFPPSLFIFVSCRLHFK